jgi:large subunit ribosomal protein L14e
MELTPIKIRGKRREHEHPAVLAAAKAKSSSRLRTKTRKSSSIESKEQQNPPTKKRKKKKKKPTTPAMPTLQGLPQELLEIIFLDSMNISLPRCSPSLGRKLSSRTVAMEFTMNSFFHTVDHRTIYRDRKNTSDPHVQSDILACRFFTYDFFLAYVQRAHDAMRELRGEIWEATGIKILGVEAFEGLYPFKFTKIVNLGFAHGFHIPEKLLHGPWTQDKASLLYVLVSMNGEIDWKGSMAGEAAKSGMNSAIEEGNERAVAALAVLLGVPLQLQHQHRPSLTLQRTDPGAGDSRARVKFP